MNRSPDCEFGVELYVDGVRISDRAGDILGFIELDLLVLKGVFVGVMEGEAEVKPDARRDGRGGVLKILGALISLIIIRHLSLPQS